MSERSCAPLQLALALLLVFVATATADEPLKRHTRTSRAITKPGFDPTAKVVDLFDGIDDGAFKAKVIANGPHSGFALIKNTTENSLTVQLPVSFTAIQVFKQFPTNDPLFGNGNANNGPNGGLTGAGGGQQQSIGGGLQAPGGNNGSGPGGPNGNTGPLGNGFFSIPPGKTVKVNFTSACLEHGKPDPTTTSTYVLIRTEVFTKDKVLQELIRMTGTRDYATRTIQAAVWHRANDMTWNELSAKYVYSLGRRVPYFTNAELETARDLVQLATTNSIAPSRESQTTVATRGR